MNVEEPLPCPFCGNEVKSQSFWWHGCAPGNGPRGYYVFCLECSETDALDGPRRDTFEDAIAAWNRRTPPAMSADHIPDASPAVTDVGKLIQAPLVGRLVDKDDLRLLLSERAELLTTVERMRGALEEAADSFARIKDYVGGRNIDFASAFVRADRGEKHARAALTTGEGK